MVQDEGMFRLWCVLCENLNNIFVININDFAHNIDKMFYVQEFI